MKIDLKQASTKKGVALIGAGVALATGHPELLTASVTSEGVQLGGLIGVLRRFCWVCGKRYGMSLMAEYQTVIVAAVSALSSGLGVGIALKTDVKWLKLMVEKLDERLTRQENKLSS